MSIEDELKLAKRKSAKPMLWVAMISMSMFFAGLTSAYVISNKRVDWVELDLPDSLYISTLVIILSSITLFFSEYFLKQGKLELSRLLLIVTYGLGLLFVYFQYVAFYDFHDKGFYFAGKDSTVSVSFIIGIVLAHVFHLLGGVVVLLVVIYNHFKKKYNKSETLGFELGAIYWHFVDVVWVFLFLFFYFIR